MSHATTALNTVDAAAMNSIVTALKWRDYKRKNVQQMLNKSVKQELNLSESQQQGCSTTYSTPFWLNSYGMDFSPQIFRFVIRRQAYSPIFQTAHLTPPNMVFEPVRALFSLEWNLQEQHHRF
jgi:hypothetical protein